MTNWYVKCKEYANCNCSYGCPCQFNALPTNGHCAYIGAFQIEEGRHGDVVLDGLCACAIGAWPGPVHEGNGRMQLVIEQRADERQREALERIMTGQDTKDMATMWWVYSKMSPNKLPTLYRAIELSIDVDGRRALLSIPGVVQSSAEPIRNPVTGAEHRARNDLPHGFEYELAEIGSGTTRTFGQIPLAFDKTYGQLARIHLNQDGVVRHAVRARQTATV
jgi:hypothetical protein